MTEQVKETMLGGVKYSMRLLGGRDAIAAGVIVAGPALRALDEILTRADVLGAFIEKIQSLQAEGKDFGNVDWKDLLALKDAHLPLVVARAIESLGIEGVIALAAVFTPLTTVHVPSGAPGDTRLFPVPLANQGDEHWKGKFPLFMAWLTWGVWAQGFFNLSQLGSSLLSAGAEAMALSKSRKDATPSPGGLS